MGLPVNVANIQVLRDVRAALCLLGDDARNALSATEMEISRMVNWLQNDRRLHWDSQIRQCRQELATYKAELFRKRTSQVMGNESNLAEPKELVRTATRKLEYAENQLAKVKRWQQPLQQALMEYRGASQPLSDSLGGDLERGLALLDRMIMVLEEYASGGPPSTPTTRSVRAESAAASVARPLEESGNGEEVSPRAETEPETVTPQPQADHKDSRANTTASPETQGG